MLCEGPENAIGERLADEGPKDDVVGDEDRVPPGLGVAGVRVGRVWDAAGDGKDGGEGVGSVGAEVGGEETPVCSEDQRDEQELEGVG